MLDTETRRRIDTARDILVGKVPDPKSQVEQITIALIYKFMNDMDAMSEELGGQRKFFIDDFARYRWAKLTRSGLGGHETLNLYAEAITRIQENPKVPQLFRDIFKNAFLPYRDPETLRAFLKVIDEFEYDHSERLGDAFEYLLSVLGSQGDAGQFRTPRHIIDFIVEIVDPKKDEKILDPACGTAGFLISAYKYVLKANTDENGGSSLTSEEQTRLAANLMGYDISPDMVRLSLANMYLHGFTDPHISEYDTLTSEDNWNEFANVILANPPFMSPKGGIQPHNRFSVKSKRSEVLFVDYMVEHLTPQGRAGIIVPEGIIFQSQNAHRRLRKMLVEEYLVAVVSLPAGVFKPYSGVKTSILILDEQLARRTNHIAFFKVENDGFELGDQRRPIEEDNLPQAKTEISEFLRRQRAKESLDDFEPTLGLIVEKEKIAENGEYNLGGERYRESNKRLSRFPIVPLGTVAEVIAGQSPPGKSYNDAGVGIPFYQGKTEFDEMYIGEPTKWTTEPKRFAEDGDILMSVRAPVGPVNFATQEICIGRGLAAIRPIEDHLGRAYTFYVLRSLESEITGNTGAAFASINKEDIKNIQIPLPPLDVQKEIVAEIERYQKIIDGARTVVDNYRPQIAVDPEWPMVALGEVCEIKTGKKDVNHSTVDGDYPFFTCALRQYKSPDYAFDTESILLPGNGANVGKVFYYKGKFQVYQRTYVLFNFEKSILGKYLYLFLDSEWENYIKYKQYGSATNYIVLGGLQKFEVPLPPLATQQAIVAEIEAEQAMVESNRKLIDRFEKKIEAVIARVWGKGETAGAEKE